MCFPIPSGVWSFCHDIETKFLLHWEPAIGEGPALELINKVPLRVTGLCIAISRLDQITPATTSTLSLFIRRLANCLATSGLRWSSAKMISASMPPSLPPLCSIARLTAFCICLPMMPAPPDNVVI